MEEEIAQIEAGIAAQEALRPALGDALVDAVVAALRARVADLRSRAAASEPARTLDTLLNAVGAAVAPEVAARLRAVGAEEPERRPVTVLAVDLRAAAGSIAAARPDDREPMLAALAAEARAVVGRHGAWPARLDGTVLVAVFGAPAVHEDDPARALRSALDLRARLDALGLRWGAPARLAAGVAVGVVTAATGAHGYEVAGPAVDAAVALARETPVGTVAVAADAERSAAGFELRREGAAWALVGESERRDPAESRGTLVGRERELAALAAVGDDLLRGRSHVVVVTGDGGIGKSRLVAEWRASTTPGLRWIEGRGFAHTRTLAFGPILDLIRALAAGDDGAPVSRPHVEALCAQLAPGASDSPALIAWLMGLALTPEEDALLARRSPQDVRQELVAFLHGALGRLARERPTVLLVEDLQWSDVSSLEVLETLVPMIRRLPLALALLTRPNSEGGADVGRLIAAAERSGGNLTRIGLAPLDPAAARAMVAVRVGDDVPPDRVDAVTRSALARAEGNPFFLEEIVRSLLAQGPDARDPEAHGAVPETPARVLQAQLDRLPREARALAQVASLLGRQFPEATLRAVADDPHADDALRALEREGILRRRRGSAWAFRHALLLDASYESLVPERRRALHQRVGEALAREGVEGPAVVGSHFARAERWDRAEEFLTRAGDAAFRVHAQAEARGHYAAALAALDRRPDAAARQRVRVDLAIRYDSVSQLSDAPEHNLARALADLDALAGSGDVDPGDALRRGRILVAQGRLQSIRGDQLAAHATVSEALAITEALGDESQSAVPRAALGLVATLRGRFHEAEGLLGAALVPLERGGESLLFLARGYFAMVCAIRGRREEALGHAEAVMSGARRSGNPRLLAQAGLTASLARCFAGEVELSTGSGVEGIQAAHACGDRMLEELGLRFLATAESRRGAHARAAEVLAEAEGVHRLVQERMLFEDWLRPMEAEIVLRAGRADEALARAEAALAADQAPSAFAAGMAHAVAGLALAGDPERGGARLARGVALLEECGAAGEAARWRRAWDDARAGVTGG